jgi:hypothetical protein
MIRLRVIRKRNPDARHHQLVRIETGIGLHGVPEAVGGGGGGAQYTTDNAISAATSNPRTRFDARSLPPRAPSFDPRWDRRRAWSAGVNPDSGQEESPKASATTRASTCISLPRQIGGHQREQRCLASTGLRHMPPASDSRILSVNTCYQARA